ncbi:Secreted subtilisin-like serine protease sub9, partial [Quaeritorhiza haematococci]
MSTSPPQTPVSESIPSAKPTTTHQHWKKTAKNWTALGLGVLAYSLTLAPTTVSAQPHFNEERFAPEPVHYQPIYHYPQGFRQYQHAPSHYRQPAHYRPEAFHYDDEPEHFRHAGAAPVRRPHAYAPVRYAPIMGYGRIRPAGFAHPPEGVHHPQSLNAASAGSTTPPPSTPSSPPPPSAPSAAAGGDLVDTVTKVLKTGNITLTPEDIKDALTDIHSFIKENIGEIVPNRYMIVLNEDVAKKEVKDFALYLDDLLKGQTHIHNLVQGAFRGILNTWDNFPGGFSGFTVEIPPFIAEILKKDPAVKRIEEDRVTGPTRPQPQSGEGPLPGEKNRLVAPDGGQQTNGMLNTNSTWNASSVEIVDQVNPPWGLDRISHRGKGTTGLYIYPDNAGENVDIYILDTGVNVAHEDFGGRARWGTVLTEDTTPIDRNGHGTHVCGIAIGATSGVAKRAQAIAVKVLDDTGKGPVSTVITAIQWILQEAAKNATRRAVVNMSLG